MADSYAAIAPSMSPRAASSTPRPLCAVDHVGTDANGVAIMCLGGRLVAAPRQLDGEIRVGDVVVLRHRDRAAPERHAVTPVADFVSRHQHERHHDHGRRDGDDARARRRICGSDQTIAISRPIIGR